MLQHIVVTPDTFFTGMTVLVVAALIVGFFIGFVYGKRRG